jgi:uncharacterized protein
MKYFENCTALITGASSGLGREFARQLAPRARALVLVARRLDRLESLKDQLMREHPALSVFCYALDLADDSRTGDFLRWLDDNDLRVNVLINNAGLGDHRYFEESEWPKIKRILDVNIVALTRLTHRLLPGMLDMPRAAILNVSSIVSFVPMPNMTVYAATKAYVSSFTESLRAELRGTRVSVTALCPGPSDTEFREVAERDSGTPMPAPEIFKLPAERIVRDGLAAVANGRARVIPGLLLAVAMALTCMTPMFLLRIFLSPRRERRRELAAEPTQPQHALR